MRFCTIATELVTGHEIWLTRGPLVAGDAGLLRAAGHLRSGLLGGRWLMDGALVNPIPITAARALGADIVICVNLNSEVRARGTVIQSYDAEVERRERDRGRDGRAPALGPVRPRRRRRGSRKPERARASRP